MIKTNDGRRFRSLPIEKITVEDVEIHLLDLKWHAVLSPQLAAVLKRLLDLLEVFGTTIGIATVIYGVGREEDVRLDFGDVSAFDFDGVKHLAFDKCSGE